MNRSIGKLASGERCMRRVRRHRVSIARKFEYGDDRHALGGSSSLMSSAAVHRGPEQGSRGPLRVACLAHQPLRHRDDRLPPQQRGDLTTIDTDNASPVARDRRATTGNDGRSVPGSWPVAIGRAQQVGCRCAARQRLRVPALASPSRAFAISALTQPAMVR